MYFETSDGKYYIGCSTNLTKRIQDHLSALTSYRHTNKGLQQASKDYGLPTVEILEYCATENIYDREIFWIKEFDSFNNGFNNTTGGDGGGFGEGMHNARYTEQEYLKILDTLANTDMNLRAVSTYLNMSLDVIKHISSLTTHGWLEERHPENYAKLKLKYLNKVRNNSAESQGIKYPLLVSPENVVYEVHNVHKFAKEHGLHCQNLHKVLTGKRLSHKNWKLNASNT